MLENTKFQFVTTEDGSLSARIGAPGLAKEDCSEAMHSLRGAFSETVYVYGTAISTAAESHFSERVLSMGLGLGYVELLSAAIAIKNDRQIRGESFEIVPELRSYFEAWLKSSDPSADVSNELPIEFKNAYDSICARTAETIQVEAKALHKAFAGAVAQNHWLIRAELNAETTFDEKFGCICFDAFSSKSTPDLWSEDFLCAFLQKTAAPQAVLSTYACTGALKRALKAENFEVQIREGFSSKRDSTFAVRSTI
jgi:hypothetical protein